MHLDQARMHRMDAACEEMGVPRADGYRLGFTTAGWSNVRPEPGATVRGGLWVVPATCMEEMDTQAAARGQSRGVLFVSSPTGPRVPATAYFDASAAEGRPNGEELEHIIVAARTAKLDTVYQSELQAHRTRI
ncbi:MAG: hypothetical protein J6386_16510 [Candidatus Synoicihabitans palmerolidicus]|nr:hypothetical protein [Candidatus Synoicihabitans palmerolidicus]